MARRTLPGGTLSFLDAMTCGLGAVILLFVVIHGDIERRAGRVTADRRAEVSRLQKEVMDGYQHLVDLRNARQDVEDRQATRRGMARQVAVQIETLREQLAHSQDTELARRGQLGQLEANLRKLDEQTRRLAATPRPAATPGSRRHRFIGDGDRQYLTGLKVGGKRIFILVDASASMLGETVVNAVRRSLLPDSVKVRAAKWRRAVSTAEWLVSQIPPDSRFQLYTFSTEAGSVVASTAGSWLDASDAGVLSRAVDGLHRVVPAGGTNLRRGFEALQGLEPPPDNLILLTDGLPTQGSRAPRHATISGRDRLKLFDQAFATLGSRIPVNVILLPMEGDPLAASAYWKRVIASGGAFLSPSRDWP